MVFVVAQLTLSRNHPAHVVQTSCH